MAEFNNYSQTNSNNSQIISSENNNLTLHNLTNSNNSSDSNNPNNLINLTNSINSNNLINLTNSINSNDLNIQNELENNLENFTEDDIENFYIQPDLISYNLLNDKINEQLNNIIVTIQIPVYTESFDKVLLKTFENVNDLCKNYNRRNKKYKINIFINDDGLLKISEDERKKRINYYNSINELFYIGRPIKNRAGKFKKASNMNFCLRQVLMSKFYHGVWNFLSIKNKFEYKKNYKIFSIGKYILLLDSDSKINPNCINDLIQELSMDDDIGYLQIKTNSMIISNNKWEKIISHFTNNIYGLNFLFSCSCGFPAPLVGHNCLLRWEYLLGISCKMFNIKNTDYKLFDFEKWYLWDENRVSEDFVLTLNLMSCGYYGKYIYWDCGMEEGVTLNIVDEIDKLKKYMYGINSIL